MKWLICSKCGKHFRDDRSAEEALLEAIFGEVLCYKCRTEKGCETCTKCGILISPYLDNKPYYFANQPYHKECLPYSL
jgi:hypothetical protein